MDHYYEKIQQRESNYEDLYYVVSQIKDHEFGEIENPAIQAFIDFIKPDIPQRCLLKGKLSGNWTIEDLASEAANYIIDTVRGSLYNHGSLDYLHPIYDTCINFNTRI